MSPEADDLSAAVTTDAHPAIQDMEPERAVERFETCIATEIDHVKLVELSKEAAHQFRADASGPIVGQDLEERDESAEHAVADRRHESDNSVAIERKLHCVAPAQQIEMSLRCWLRWPADEEPTELVGPDRIGAIDVHDHAADPTPDANRIAWASVRECHLSALAIMRACT